MVPLGFRSVIGGPKSGGQRGSEDPRERSNTSKGYMSQEILVKNFNISSSCVHFPSSIVFFLFSRIDSKILGGFKTPLKDFLM